jgi:hypothetical protein
MYRFVSRSYKTLLIIVLVASSLIIASDSPIGFSEAHYMESLTAKIHLTDKNGSSLAYCYAGQSEYERGEDDKWAVDLYPVQVRTDKEMERSWSAGLSFKKKSSSESFFIAKDGSYSGWGDTSAPNVGYL